VVSTAAPRERVPDDHDVELSTLQPIRRVHHGVGNATGEFLASESAAAAMPELLALGSIVGNLPIATARRGTLDDHYCASSGHRYSYVLSRRLPCRPPIPMEVRNCVRFSATPL